MSNGWRRLGACLAAALLSCGIAQAGVVVIDDCDEPGQPPPAYYPWPDLVGQSWQLYRVRGPCCPHYPPYVVPLSTRPLKVCPYTAPCPAWGPAPAAAPAQPRPTAPAQPQPATSGDVRT